MASSSFTPQLLINEGELSEILRIIKSAESNEAKIIGNLYGLWRNSLIQPVVQLITGPGWKAKISKQKCIPDDHYNKQIKSYLEGEHGLLQIGVWVSGSANRYPKFNRDSPKFKLKSKLLPQDGRYVALIFVDYTEESLRIEYHIFDRDESHLSHCGDLTAKDILPGASSFRELRPVFEGIDYGSKFPSGSDRQTNHFSMNMLRANHPQPNHFRPRAQTAPASSRTADKPPEQWYECDGGETLLRRLMNGFRSHDVDVNISRDTDTRDLTLEVNRSVCLNFPANFPAGQMSLTWVNDTAAFTRNPDHICRTIVNRVSDIISYETARSLSRHTQV